MLSKALADIIANADKQPPMARTIFDFIGEPLVAMTLAVALAMVTFGYAVGLDGAEDLLAHQRERRRRSPR